MGASKRIEGLKGVADALAKLWRCKVDIHRVRRLAARKSDPLPLPGPRYSRVAITKRALTEWAKRNRLRVRRQATEGDEKQLPLFGSGGSGGSDGGPSARSEGHR